jgi:2-hydroxychromene-2-carboxylate isomerase
MMGLELEAAGHLPNVTFYFDVRSPYAYLARDEVLALDQEFAVTVEPLPYPIALEETYGVPEARTLRETRKIKYMYMDVRRFAKERGLIIRGTVKIYDPHLAHAAFLYAKKHGRERVLYDRLLPAFWNRTCDIENAEYIASLLRDAGADPDGFGAYLQHSAQPDLASIARAAEEAGVFGVPTCVYGGELFWGADRIALLKQRLGDAGLRGIQA